IVPDLIRQIAQHRFFIDWVSFSKNRGQDKNTAAKLLLLEFRGKLVDTKKVHLDRFTFEGVQSETDTFGNAAARVKVNLDKMKNVFGIKDSLLSSQGPVPIYYWLVRTLGDQPRLREFLAAFEKARRTNAEIAKNNPIEADQELLAYDVLNRSTNDQASLVK